MEGLPPDNHSEFGCVWGGGGGGGGVGRGMEESWIFTIRPSQEGGRVVKNSPESGERGVLHIQNWEEGPNFPLNLPQCLSESGLDKEVGMVGRQGCGGSGEWSLEDMGLGGEGCAIYMPSSTVN